MPASKHDINFLKDIKEDETIVKLLDGKVIFVADLLLRIKPLIQLN